LISRSLLGQNKKEARKLATITTQTDEQTTTEITPGMTVGAGAVLSQLVRQLQASDRADANTLGEAITSEDVSLTVTDNNSGATMTVDARRATVGCDTEQAVWSNISAPQALRMVFAMAGAMAPHMEAHLDSMLQAVADGASWEDAFEAVTGHALTDDRREAADERVASTRRSVVTDRRGRQQASGVTISN